MTTGVERHLFAPSMALCIVAVAVAWIVRAKAELTAGDAFYHLYVTHDAAAAVAYLFILAGALVLYPRVPLAAVAAALRRAVMLRYPLALLAVGLAAAGALVVYRDHPLTMDEYAPLFQARVFSQGQLSAELPPDLLPWLFHERFLSLFFLSSETTGRVISQYWPGFAVLLAPFVRLDVAWLLNPLLTAGSLLLLIHLARRLLPGTEAAGWALLLALASPQLTINAISYYSMSAHLFLNLLFAALLLQPTTARTLLAGVIGSLAVTLHQPLPHLLFALPWFVWLARHGRPIRRLATLLLGYLPLGLLLGVGWLVLKSHIESEAAPPSRPRPPILEIQPVAGAQPAPRSAAGALLARLEGQMGLFKWPDAEILEWRLLGLLKLFLWAMPGLPILALVGYRNCRRAGNTVALEARRWNTVTPEAWNTAGGLRVLGYSALCSLVGYLFIPYSQGHGWGYRYFHQAWGVLPLLAAAALVSSGSSRAEWMRVAGLLAAASLLILTPLRVAQVHGFVGRHLDQLPPLAAEGHQICFLDTDRGFYVQDLVQNDPFLRRPVTILESRGPKADKALIQRRFPGARRVHSNESGTVWTLKHKPAFR